MEAIDLIEPDSVVKALRAATAPQPEWRRYDPVQEHAHAYRWLKIAFQHLIGLGPPFPADEPGWPPRRVQEFHRLGFIDRITTYSKMFDPTDDAFGLWEDAMWKHYDRERRQVRKGMLKQMH
jgi:hypothetical protein